MKEGIEKIYFYPASNVENCGLVGKSKGADEIPAHCRHTFNNSSK